MMKLPAMYTPEQLIDIQNFITANFGSNETDYIVHELESKDVHTDVLIVDNQADLKVFASIGMVNYLTLIPLYENERNFIVKNGDTKFLPKLLEKYGANIFVLDKMRKGVI